MEKRHWKNISKNNYSIDFGEIDIEDVSFYSESIASSWKHNAIEMHLKLNEMN